ncbi:hypothetical protein [Microbacterium sp. 179-I 3D3 NHS]|uniref:hypothetical protein n=1 Tax=Microbacterium sp. 179-I 3D3 NHS TaxID=3142382 RepID=UPI0039A2CAA3
MTDVETMDRSEVLLPGAHRVVRVLDPTEGPFAGALVTQGEAVAVRVDASALAGWAGWRFAGAEHVAGPVDVIRRVDGHDALLPWCTEQVLGYLARRSAAGAPLPAGECSTLVVSLLRGLDELGADADGVRTGVWWLTDGGRPTLVIGDGHDARDDAAQIIERLIGGCRDKGSLRVLSTVRQGLLAALPHPRVPRPLLNQWEGELLAIAAPRPLTRDTFAPERACDIARVRDPKERLVRPTRADRPTTRRALSRRKSRVRPRLSSIGSPIMAAVDALRVWKESRVRGTRSNRSPVRAAHDRSAPGRRRPALIVAGGAAVVVLVGGLVWPTGESGESAARAGGAADLESPASSSDPGAAPPSPESSSAVTRATEDPSAGSPEAAVTALLARIAECRDAGDQICADAVAPGATGVVASVSLPADRFPTTELVDEYGDVAVIRLGSSGDIGGPAPGDDRAPAMTEQMLVLARLNEKWLVRDVYGVADQPG